MSLFKSSALSWRPPQTFLTNVISTLFLPYHRPLITVPYHGASQQYNTQMARHAVLRWMKFEHSWTPLMPSCCSYCQQGAVFRASYVREATRFKATSADVNDPSRNQQVIQGAVDAAPSVHLPQIIAQIVYEGIVNSSVLFEECIVSATPIFRSYPFLIVRKVRHLR